MKYIAIIGSNYKDCKSKFNSIEKQPGAKYTLVTKPKHLNGIPFSEVILADMAKDNPSFSEMSKSVKKIIASGPKVEKTIKRVVEKPVEDVKKEEPVFDSPVDEDEPMIGADEDGNAPYPSHLYEEEPKKEPEVDELPPEELTVEEPLEVDETPVPVIDEIPADEPAEEVAEEEPETGDEEFWNAEVSESIPEDVETEPTTGDETFWETEPVEETSEEEVVPETAPEEEEVDIKPVNPPRGWHLRNEFIDEVGNIFHKGQYVGKQTDE
jgi:hypothetical protein